MFRQLISRFTVTPFVALLGKKQPSWVHSVPHFERTSQTLPLGIEKSCREIRSFAQNNGIVIGENKKAFAPKSQWISTFGVRGCRVLLCQTSEDRSYLAHVLPGRHIADYLPEYLTNKEISSGIKYSIINGPELIAITSKSAKIDLNERSIIRNPEFILQTFRAKAFPFNVPSDSAQANTIDVLFSPLGTVYIMEYNAG